MTYQSNEPASYNNGEDHEWCLCPRSVKDSAIEENDGELGHGYRNRPRNLQDIQGFEAIENLVWRHVSIVYTLF